MTTRLQINITDDTAAELRGIAKKRGCSVTEIIRRSIAVYKFVEDEVVEGGRTLRLVDSDGRESIVTIL